MEKMDLKIKKKVKYICYVMLVFACTLCSKVQAAEDSGILFSDSAKVYTEMSDDSDVIANLIAGNMFEALGAESDPSGVVWYHVRTDFGAEGYVKANELERVLMEAQKIQSQEQSQNPAPNEDTEGDEDPGNVDEGEEDAEAAGDDNENPEPNGGDGNKEPLGALVVLEAVNLRRMPSTDSEIMSRINLNTKLSFFEQYTSDSGEIWYRVEYENMTGYVTERAVMITQQESQADEERVEQSTSAKEPLQKNETMQNKRQFEKETLTAANQDKFEVDEKQDVQEKNRRGGIDWVIVILILGGALCIAAIVILIKKILKLLRK